jgi:D-alanyl-D-alanine carboxypeptidase/D-alanyl-D-alanine-endopeptidase (penicillin-binding protein 4)
MLSILIYGLVIAAPIYEASEAEVDAYLSENTNTEVSFKEHLRKVVSDSIGTPYQDGPLGEGPNGQFDTDPLIDLKRVDCVTYVEQTVAMTTARSYSALVENLQKIRYKGGRIGFEQRNHFMISDWVRNNAWCREMTHEIPVKTEQVNRTISKKDFFKKVNAAEVGQRTKDEQVALTIVPTELTAQAEAGIPDGSLVVFVGKVDWLFSLHCGMYIRDEDGNGSLVHASSKAGKVVSMPLTQYMQDQSQRYIGFSVYEMERPAWKSSRGLSDSF